jgi:sulfatase maturation enzyme AslB (radical SAM superfamily)
MRKPLLDTQRAPELPGDTDVDSIICLRPFYSLELNLKGDVSVCCPAWSKGMIGNTKSKSLLEIWNGKPLQHMRRMMLEGSWEKICRPNCPHIMQYRMNGGKVLLADSDNYVITPDIISAVRSRQTNLSAGPTWINLANSSACNLHCIMCGREKYQDDDRRMKQEITEVRQLLPGVRELFLTGNGDPFARSDTRELMLNLDSSLYPDLKINLLTNGLLLPKYWERIRHLNFGCLNISCDAGTKETYEKIRLGGRWQDLIKAFEIISGARDRFSYIMINMTVMRDNYREIPAFVELASRYGFGVGINRVRGKWGEQNFFASADKKVLDELRSVITEAQAMAKSLNVHFNSSSFDDIMAGQALPVKERYQQLAIDLLRSIYHKLK